MNAEQLRWMVPTGVVVAGILWKFFRPSCEAAFFFVIDGAPRRRDESVRAALARELEQIAGDRDRLERAEEMLAAQADSLAAFEQSLLAQGQTLANQISQVFNPLNRTLEKMEKSLEHIARDTNNNSVAIGELRGMWDGSERRIGRSDRRE